jgi:hypothetical protein
MMLQLSPKSHQLNRLSSYYATQRLTKEWMQPVSVQHEMFPSTIKETKNGAQGLPAVTLYAVRRPDKQWALLAINKNPKRAAQLKVEFNLPGAKEPLSYVGQVNVIQFSRAQYSWRSDGPNGHPIRSLPPAHSTHEASTFYDLPPYSLTIVRGKLPNS